MSYKGVIIEESLRNKSILDYFKILSTKVEQVTKHHRTPWVKQWTLHTVKLQEAEAGSVAELLSHSLDTSHKTTWYADYKNDKFHYIIFPNKVFKIDLSSPILYKEARSYGISIGIPEYQVDFAPEDKIWKR